MQLIKKSLILLVSENGIKAANLASKNVSRLGFFPNIMNNNEIKSEILALEPSLPRKAWLPVITDTPPDLASLSYLTSTKFGGSAPWMRPNETWPECPKCHAPKYFLFQVNLAQLPGDYQAIVGLSTGLLQVFFCIKKCKYTPLFEDIRLIPHEEFNQPLSLKGIGTTNSLRHKEVEVKNCFREIFVKEWEELEKLEMPDISELWSQFALDEVYRWSDGYEDAFSKDDVSQTFGYPWETKTAKLGNPIFCYNINN